MGSEQREAMDTGFIEWIDGKGWLHGGRERGTHLLC